MTPAESDFLLRLASLSSSVWLVFPPSWSPSGVRSEAKLSDQHLRLVRLYIEGGRLVTALGLVPTLLNLLQIPESVTWPVSSVAAASIFTFVLVTQFRRRRLVEGRIPPWVVIVYALSLAHSLWASGSMPRGFHFRRASALTPLP